MGHRFSQIYTDNNYIVAYAFIGRRVFVKEKRLLSVYFYVNLCPIKFYLAPLPKRTIFIVRKMIIRSIKTDIFLM